MAGWGTDHTKSLSELDGPVVVLVEPQLGENIGMAARAMGNFGLTRLRIVNPRDGWPNVHARRAASGADHILDKVELFATVEQAFFDSLVRDLDKVEFLRPAEKRETMLVNLRNIFSRMEPTKQDMHTLHGVVMAIAEGRKGPAKGGVLDGEQATRLRALLAEHGQGALPSETGKVRGLPRLFRRTPTNPALTLSQPLPPHQPLSRAVRPPAAGGPPT